MLKRRVLRLLLTVGKIAVIKLREFGGSPSGTIPSQALANAIEGVTTIM